jgi:choloylglycine hydrolase
MAARIRGLVLLTILCLAVALPASPCSSFAFPNNGFLVFGANYDNAFAPGLLFVNPRHVRKSGWETGTTGRTAAWTSRYGSVTIACAGYHIPWGGMNEAGLVFSTMALKGSRGQAPDERPPLDGAIWWQYALDTCATIEEVRAAFRSVRIGSTDDHYLVCDRAGGCAVVEFLEGRMVVIGEGDVPVRALANEPYGRCLEQMTETRIARADPHHSYNRFNRLAAGLASFKDGSAAAAVDHAFGLLAGVASAFTRWSIVFDTERRIFHIRSYKNTKTRFIDLARLDFSCGRPAAMLDAHADLEGDISARFRPYDHDEVLRHMIRSLAYFDPDVRQERIRQALALIEAFPCDPGEKTPAPAAGVPAARPAAFE